MGGKPTEFRSAQFPKNALAVPCREQARSAANTAAVADAKLANTRAARLTPLAPEMVSPGRKPLPAGAVVVQSNSAKGPVSRILSCAVIPLGAASPRTLISDLPGGFGNCLSRLGAPGRHATAAWLLAAASLPIWSCSVWGLPCPGLYRPGGALLPHLFTLTSALTQQAASGSPSRKRGSRGGIFSVALAVHGF